MIRIAWWVSMMAASWVATGWTWMAPEWSWRLPGVLLAVGFVCCALFVEAVVDYVQPARHKVGGRDGR